MNVWVETHTYQPVLTLIGFIPGMNPRPTARMGFSAALLELIHVLQELGVVAYFLKPADQQLHGFDRR
jgi:hypothetical protein